MPMHARPNLHFLPEYAGQSFVFFKEYVLERHKYLWNALLFIM